MKRSENTEACSSAVASNAGLGAEWDELVAAFGITPKERIEMLKDTAMARHNVKKSRQKHIRRILDEAFELLEEYAPNVL